MFFSITELEHHPILFDVLYQPGEIAFPEDLRQIGSLAAQGRTELLRNTLGEIRIRGHVKAVMEGVCDRCLEPARLEIDSDFDLFYRPVVRTANHAEIQLEDGEIDLAFYEGEGVELADALREQILLSMPMQLFCRPDCKGLCPYCGANRNQVNCGCRSPFVDPRWASLRDLG
ncbi:MAG: DUF177 domain-containing protein [Bryobacteraceae bacterium]|nr:DUF177 domain-containing protein [Bryobacteraceae bacterium]